MAPANEHAADLKLKALADPTRREIVHRVAEAEISASELASTFDMSRPAVSQHLKVLLDAGLVSVREDGTRRYYSSDRTALRALFQQLDEYWSLGLLRLQRAAERRRGGRPGRKPGR